jgi:hypothetical protein
MGKPQDRRLMADFIACLTAPRGARVAVALVVAIGAGLMLGACTKCDVPNWFPNKPGQSPQSCHDAPAPQ